MSEFVRNLDALPSAVWHQRKRLGLSLRAAAAEMGLSFNTLTRLEHGDNVTLAQIRAAAAWIDHERTTTAPTEAHDEQAAVAATEGSEL